MSKAETVFVTGGASGIGLAIVKEVLKAGWRAVIADHDQVNLDLCCQELGAIADQVRFEQLDITDEGAVVSAICRSESELGPLVGLVNSAGIGSETAAMETSATLFRKILEVNVIGAFVVAREMARRMSERKNGSMINIASVSGIQGNCGRVAYGASKGALITMTRVMAVEFAPMGIRVNAIAPGPIETPLVREMHAETTRKEWIARIPQHRYGKPSEVAGAAIFLLDRTRSSYVTGQTLCVDGGFTAAGLMAGDN